MFGEAVTWPPLCPRVVLIVGRLQRSQVREVDLSDEAKVQTLVPNAQPEDRPMLRERRFGPRHSIKTCTPGRRPVCARRGHVMSHWAVSWWAETGATTPG
jgi:hypothetical protein